MKLDINRGSPDACWTFQIVDSLYKIYLLKKKTCICNGNYQSFNFQYRCKKGCQDKSRQPFACVCRKKKYYAMILFPIGKMVFPAKSLMMIPAIMYQADSAHTISG